MGNKNTNLQVAKRAKDDEFYTTYETIQKEVFHYVAQFEGKTVLCNCDDPFESNFCKFFLKNFNKLFLTVMQKTFSALKAPSKPPFFFVQHQQKQKLVFEHFVHHLNKNEHTFVCAYCTTQMLVVYALLLDFLEFFNYNLLVN